MLESFRIQSPYMELDINISLPCLPQILREKLLYAIRHCSAIDSDTAAVRPQRQKLLFTHCPFAAKHISKDSDPVVSDSAQPFRK